MGIKGRVLMVRGNALKKNNLRSKSREVSSYGCHAQATPDGSQNYEEPKATLSRPVIKESSGL